MDPVEKRLTEAMLEFGARHAQFMQDRDTKAFAPAIMRFRFELDSAAGASVERWQAWHLIGPWVADPKDQLYCLRRVLALLQAGHSNAVAPNRDRFVSTHDLLRAQTLVQMAEIHLKAGDRDEARGCYERALPCLRTALNVHGDAAVAGSGLEGLEGRIIAALRTLNANKT